MYWGGTAEREWSESGMPERWSYGWEGGGGGGERSEGEKMVVVCVICLYFKGYLRSSGFRAIMSSWFSFNWGVEAQCRWPSPRDGGKGLWNGTLWSTGTSGALRLWDCLRSTKYFASSFYTTSVHHRRCKSVFLDFLLLLETMLLTSLSLSLSLSLSIFLPVANLRSMLHYLRIKNIF